MSVTASYLMRMGLKKGDRAAIIGENSPALVLCVSVNSDSRRRGGPDGLPTRARGDTEPPVRLRFKDNLPQPDDRSSSEDRC